MLWSRLVVEISPSTNAWLSGVSGTVGAVGEGCEAGGDWKPHDSDQDLQDDEPKLALLRIVGSIPH